LKKKLYFFQVNYAYGKSAHLPYTAAQISAYAFADKDVAENFELAEMEYDLAREPFTLGKDPIDLKIMVDGGLVQEVLKNRDLSIDVEILDLDVGAEDHDKLLEYWDEITKDPSYIPCSHIAAADYIDDLPPGENQDKPSLDTLLQQAEREVAKHPEPPTPGKNNEKVPEIDN
jgi:hypothetical protein